MQEYNWIDMMNKMQELRLFCSLTVRGAKKEGLTSAQELDLLSRAVLSKVPLTPQEFSISMGLKKSAVSRLLRGLIEKKTSGKDTQRRGPQKLYDSRDGSRARGASADVSVLSGADLPSEAGDGRREFQAADGTYPSGK